MKHTFVFAAIITLASTSFAQAGCDFFSEEGKKGEKFALMDGECAILGDIKTTNACDGFKIKEVNGWNDKIQSITLNHNSTAFLLQHEDGSGLTGKFVGNRGVSTLGEMNKHSSVARCYQ